MLSQSCADNLKRMWFQTQDSADEGLTFQSKDPSSFV
jgi:hypothetical protein